MSYGDILLHLDTYPDAAPLDGVDRAVAMCAALGDRVTAVAFQVRIPVRSNFVAERLLGLSKMAQEEEARSLDNGWALLARFAEAAEKAGLANHQLPIEEIYLDRPERLAKLARTRDICVIPYFGEVAPQVATAEAVVFGSGRPVLVFGADAEQVPPPAFKSILVAWDGGRAASRAVADALPLLRRAEEVCVLSVLGDKPATVGGQAEALAAHLARLGIQAETQEQMADGRAAGGVIARAAAERGADLLVMGAYGHSRMREFLLGGVTDTLLTVPPLPVLMSH